MTRKRKARRGGAIECRTAAPPQRVTKPVVFAGLAGLIAVAGLGLGVLWPRYSAAGTVGSDGGAEQTRADDTSLYVLPTEPRPAAHDVHPVFDLTEVPPGPPDRVEVAYFHRTHRCSGCVLAEDLTRLTLNQRFAGQLQRGDIQLLVEDCQKPADPGLVERYGAYGSSLYLGVVKGGATYVYEVRDVWFVLGDEARFAATLGGYVERALAGS